MEENSWLDVESLFNQRLFDLVTHLNVCFLPGRRTQIESPPSLFEFELVHGGQDVAQRAVRNQIQEKSLSQSQGRGIFALLSQIILLELDHLGDQLGQRFGRRGIRRNVLKKYFCKIEIFFTTNLTFAYLFSIFSQPIFDRF